MSRSSNGVYARDLIWSDIEDLGDQRRHEGRQRAKRSAVAADALELGTVALELLDAHPEAKYRPIQEQRALVRQALQEYLRREFPDS